MTQVRRSPAKSPKTILERRQSKERAIKEEAVEETNEVEQIKLIKHVIKEPEKREPPKFLQPIQPQVVKEENSCTFTAQVKGMPKPSVTWLKEKV